MTAFTEGKVIAVVEETDGSELAVDAASGATTLTIVDGQDFEDVAGSVGSLTIDGDDYLFGSRAGVGEPETIDISPGLLGAYPAGTPVYPHPLGAVERFAHVMTPEADEELVCRIPHQLYERLGVGLRGEEVGAAAPPSYAGLVDADGAALYWTLDSVTGATDQAGSANGTGAGGVTIGGDASEPAGFTSGSTDFDGSNDYVSENTYNPLPAGGVRTYEVWAYRETAAAYNPVFTLDAALPSQVYLNHPGGAGGVSRVVFNINGTGANWDGAWPGTGQWVHLALIFDDAANTAELFINGVSKGVQAQAGTNPGWNSLRLGHDNAYSGAFDGKLAHFAVYPSALSAAQIFAHYENGAGLAVAAEVIPADPPENVIATLDDDEWVITDVLDKSPDISGAFVNAGQDSVPFGVGSTPVTASYVATDATITVTPENDGKLMVFWAAGVIFETNASGVLTVDVTLSLLVDGVQVGQERSARFHSLTFSSGTHDMEIPVGGTTSVEVEGGVEVVLAVGVKGIESVGQAFVASGKTGGISYVALGG